MVDYKICQGCLGSISINAPFLNNANLLLTAVFSVGGADIVSSGADIVSGADELDILGP